MRRHTDKNWLEGDPVVKLFKVIITEAMQTWKQTEWQGLPEWKYEIREVDVNQSIAVQIIAGIAPVVLWQMEREYFIDDDEFKKNEKRREVWKRIVVEAMMSGFVNSYKTAVDIARNTVDGFLFTKEMGNNPLTIEEFKLKQDSAAHGAAVHERLHKLSDNTLDQSEHL